MRQDFDIAAYYWPAYHDEPRWRPFMPKGEGEWETIRAATPKFPGHRQPRAPLWGYLDESDPRVMEKKIAAAVDHGVNVFIFDWYWYDNQPFLEKALNDGFLGARNNDRARFFLMWANHDATTLWDLTRSHLKPAEVIWPGAADRETFDRVIDRVIARYFSHPSYYKIDGKPVFSIYELSTFINGLGGIGAARDALDAFRAKTRKAGFPGAHIQAILWSRLPVSASMVPGDKSETMNNTVQTLGIDSLTNYQWCHYVTAKGAYRNWAKSAISRWDAWADEFSAPFFPHVSIGWDTNPRFKCPIENYIDETTPELYGKYLREAMAFIERRNLSPKLITVNSWNEWSEGSYLEPDTTFGMGYLEATRDALLARGEEK